MKTVDGQQRQDEVVGTEEDLDRELVRHGRASDILLSISGFILAFVIVLISRGVLPHSTLAPMAVLLGSILGLAIVTGRVAKASCPWILAAGLVLRLAALTNGPFLSDDHHRYAWDGACLRSGGNPYRTSPGASAQLPPGAPDPGLINHPDLPTIYPPGAITLFAGAGILAPGPIGLKLLWSGFDLTVLLLLYRTVGRRRLVPRPEIGLALWALSPAVVVDGLLELHPELLAAPALLLALFFGSRGQPLRAAIAGALAFLIKIIPGLVLLPIVIRAGSGGRAVRSALAAIALITLAYLPFAFGGGALGSSPRYALSWEANGPVYAIVAHTMTQTDIPDRLKDAWSRRKERAGDPAWMSTVYPYFYAGFLARCLLGLVWSALVVLILVRNRSTLEATLQILLLYLLLSPTVHPWYLLLLIPPLIMWRHYDEPIAVFSLAWLATIPLAYLLPEGNRVADAPLLVSVEYGLPLLLAGFAWRKQRQVGTAPSSSPK